MSLVPSPFSRPASSAAPGLFSVADFNKLAAYPNYSPPAAQVVTAVTTANGLNLFSGTLSMSLASPGFPGAMPGSDKTKLDTYPGAYSAPAVTSVTTGNGLNLAAGVLSMSPSAVSSVTQANGLTLTAGVLAVTLASGATSGTVSGGAQSFNGVKTFASAPVFSAGAQSASLFNTNGTVSTDVATLFGFTTVDGSVNTTARMASFGAGIGGTYVERIAFAKSAATFGTTTLEMPLTVWGGANAGAQGPLYVNGRATDTIGTAITLTADLGGGGTWNMLSTGSTAGFGGGHFAMFHTTGSQYRSLWRSDGLFWTRGITGQTTINLHETQNAGGSVMFQVSSIGVTTAANDVRSNTGYFRGASSANGYCFVDDATIGARLWYNGNHFTANNGTITMAATGGATLSSVGGIITIKSDYVRIGTNIGQSSGQVGVQFGFQTADGSVHSGAKLWQAATDLNGSLVEKAFMLKDGTLELTGAGVGHVLQSPNGTRWRLTITNAGAVLVAAA